MNTAIHFSVKHALRTRRASRVTRATKDQLAKETFMAMISHSEKDYVDDSDMLKDANRLEVPTKDIGPSIFVPSNKLNK